MTISFVMSVFPSVCLSVCPHGTTRLTFRGFLLNLTFDFFRKSFEKIKIVLKCIKNNGKFTSRHVCIYHDVFLWIFRKMRSISGKRCVQNQNTFYVETHSSENYAVCKKT